MEQNEHKLNQVEHKRSQGISVQYELENAQIHIIQAPNLDISNSSAKSIIQLSTNFVFQDMGTKSPIKYTNNHQTSPRNIKTTQKSSHNHPKIA